MRLNIGLLQRSEFPFPHYTAEQFLDAATVHLINAEWPTEGSRERADWLYEEGYNGIKASLLFPRRLPPTAQAVATALYTPEVCWGISQLLGFAVYPDPWFVEGPTHPAVGGGLHEIHPGGFLRMHVDFDAHPSGWSRVANLLIYLNLQWDPLWGGKLRLAADEQGAFAKQLEITGGNAVLFATHGGTWHGHPEPLRCRPERRRRSLALYYYSPDGERQRLTTKYAKKGVKA